MFYQKILPASSPYAASYSMGNKGFPMHKHHEIELHYCIKGSILMKLSETEYKVMPGEMIVVGSMTAHELISKEVGTASLFIEFGPAFLHEYFDTLVDLDLGDPIIKKEDFLDSPALLSALSDMIELNGKSDEVSKMNSVGCIWRIASEIARIKRGESKRDEKKKSLKIEKVISYIHAHYAEDITLDDATSLVGYSKGSFCKTFKDATGMGFHSYLNNYRIQSSLYLLKNTEMAIGEVAEAVGFSEFKSFCRVFKSVMGLTPSEYKR